MITQFSKKKETIRTCDYKKFLRIFSKLPNRSEHVTLDNIDLRVEHLVNKYNSCSDEVKHKFKKRLELIVQQNFDQPVKLDWPNIIDNLVIKRVCYFITRNKDTMGKLLPVTVLLDIELDEVINCVQIKNKTIRSDCKYSELPKLYNTLTEEDQVSLKLWILPYFDNKEPLGQEIVEKYLQPDIDFYEIIKLSNKTARGKRFLLDLLKEILISKFVSEKREKVIMR